jgi:trans-2,3-dihydro-3-hydroxyanthranilate isomerase
MTEFIHVDVFADSPYHGNSLAVFLDPPTLSTAQMLRITQELRHFESIFVTRSRHPGRVLARVFDLFGELPFAGHPVLGAAAALHTVDVPSVTRRADWSFQLSNATVHVSTQRHQDGRLSGLLDQGRPRMAPPLHGRRSQVAAAFGLTADDLLASPLPQVISTGLAYLIVPVTAAAIGRATVSPNEMQARLNEFGADFAYILDPVGRQGRTWNNDGILEDVATGSAAGCVAAYLLHNGLARSGETVELHQGQYVGRPSVLRIHAFGDRSGVHRVTVEGSVSVVATGKLLTLPEDSP